ncbi:hypothetical protein Vadar_014900 [Vaccinium darrowii]|uniref:Uncharacterized protein n=1 Tax=Vaccinium darrowii TaxID=229202 RepID=A0ACB7Z3S0_9ERIC|nr:hypothetical protein Vadar_014900 [Vaccinium darrowii]
MDGDYAGLLIFSVYKYRSSNLIFDNDRLATPDMMLLGVLLSDLGLYKLKKYSEMIRKPELNKIGSFLKKKFVKEDKALSQELKLMKTNKRKVKIEALDGLGSDPLVHYLKDKIATSKWI